MCHNVFESLPILDQHIDDKHPEVSRIHKVLRGLVCVEDSGETKARALGYYLAGGCYTDRK